MNEQSMSKEELSRRRKLVFDHFTRPEQLDRSEPHAFILISAGQDVRSYYIMEGYTDGRIYINLRELFRKFRQGERIACEDSIIKELQQVGLELALFCIRSRYQLAIELCGTSINDMDQIIYSLRNLDYQVQKIFIHPDENPYVDIDPYDCEDVLTQNLCNQMVKYWIETASIKVLLEESGPGI